MNEDDVIHVGAVDIEHGDIVAEAAAFGDFGFLQIDVTLVQVLLDLLLAP